MNTNVMKICGVKGVFTDFCDVEICSPVCMCVQYARVCVVFTACVSACVHVFRRVCCGECVVCVEGACESVFKGVCDNRETTERRQTTERRHV